MEKGLRLENGMNLIIVKNEQLQPTLQLASPFLAAAKTAGRIIVGSCEAAGSTMKP